MRSGLWLVVAELLGPVSGSALGGQVEQVPERFERPDVAGILTWLGGCVKEL
jgi:hypothetical protein